jgi:signal transduction histidine kinase
MFRSLRWRLTVWFLSLTTLVFVVFVVIARIMFSYDLTSVLDNELQAVAMEASPAIEIHKSKPQLPSWAEGKPRKTVTLPATIQLFDAGGMLLEQYGPDAPAMLFKSTKEIRIGTFRNRIWCTELFHHHKPVGYLQIQLPTRLRDRALRHFEEVMWKILPAALIMLGLSGYFFAGLAMRPIEQGFNVLKRFMADAGHELSTPINIIQINTESMEEKLQSDPALSKSAQIISRSTERLSSLVRDLMLLAKMESPRLTINLVPLRLDECIKRVIEEFNAPYLSKGVDLRCGNLTSTTVLGDNGSLTRMIGNLLQNALRYTEKAGHVSIELVTERGNARLSVQDSGKGIPSESLKYIFDRFYRVDKSRSRSDGGSGLGLAVVKAIAQAHKGRVEVQSTLDVGSTFSVILPTGLSPFSRTRD